MISVIVSDLKRFKINQPSILLKKTLSGHNFVKTGEFLNLSIIFTLN